MPTQIWKYKLGEAFWDKRQHLTFQERGALDKGVWQKKKIRIIEKSSW